jgi:hypothetical protein
MSRAVLHDRVAGVQMNGSALVEIDQTSPAMMYSKSIVSVVCMPGNVSSADL